MIYAVAHVRIDGEWRRFDALADTAEEAEAEVDAQIAAAPIGTHTIEERP